jgi:hypothetical protein
MNVISDIADQNQPPGPQRGHRGRPGGEAGRVFAVVARGQKARGKDHERHGEVGGWWRPS